jgi:hypothetical protein
MGVEADLDRPPGLVCRSGPNVLVTTRKPDDLPAFSHQLLTEFQRQKQTA